MSSLLRFRCISQNHYKCVEKEKIAYQLDELCKNIEHVVCCCKYEGKLAQGYDAEAYAQEKSVLIAILLVF